MEFEGELARTKIGDRPEYADIALISSQDYALLATEADALLSTEQTWMMKKYEYSVMLSCLSSTEKSHFWSMFRDNLRKVLNIKREFQDKVMTVENLSNYRMTLRAGGQDLRARQLSEIRVICNFLGLSTLHEVDKLEISAGCLTNVKQYAWQRREQMAELFEY